MSEAMNSIYFCFCFFFFFFFVECLSCWNHLCSNENVDSSNCPQSCYTFTGKLIGELGAADNQECCSYAEQYVSSIENNNAFVSFDESQECPKSGIYNDVPEDFDSANYDDDKFAYGEQYFLFSEVKFGCSGCVSNVSIHSFFCSKSGYRHGLSDMDYCKK